MIDTKCGKCRERKGFAGGSFVGGTVEIQGEQFLIRKWTREEFMRIWWLS